jgi:hypothetical protein
MNMVECFFSILTRQALTQSVQCSKKVLKELLLGYLKKYSENPRPSTVDQRAGTVAANYRGDQSVPGRSPQAA